MAEIVNDRDTRLQNTVPRVGVEGAGVILVASSQTVKTVAGALYPAVITFEAMQFVQGPLVWAVDGATLTGAGATRALDTGTMTKDTITVTATVTPAGGTPRAHTVTINRIADGRDGLDGTGTPGARGAGMYYTAGGAWTDAAADAATPGGNVVGDLVTISNGTFFLSKRWNGSSWEPPGTVLDGSLFVTRSIGAAAINTNGLEIRDEQGNLILGSGSALRDEYVPTSAQNSAVAVGNNLCYNGDFSNGLDGWTAAPNLGNAVIYYSNAQHPGGAGNGWAVNAGVGQGSTTLQIHQPDVLQEPAFVELFSDPIPVVAGERYCVSAYSGAHRCRVDVFAYILNTSGDVIGYWGDTDYNNEQASGGQQLSNYKRHQQFAEIPAAGAAVRVAIRKYATVVRTGVVDSWLFVARVQIEQAGATAVAAGPWNPPAPSTANYRDIVNSKTELAAIASDSVLSKGEKLDVVQRWDTCDLEKASLVAQAAGLVVSSAAYVAAHQAVSDYLGTLSPLWSDVTQDSPINPTIWKDRWNTYYDQKQRLINAMAAKAATTAEWNSVGGAGRPENNATVGANIGTNLTGQITGANVSTYIAAAAINLAQINKASIGSLDALTGNFGSFYSGTPGGAGTLISGPKIEITDAGNMVRIQIGKHT